MADLEYAFDVKVTGVIRVQAGSEERAREIVGTVDGLELNAYLSRDGKVMITEISVDPSSVELFEAGTPCRPELVAAARVLLEPIED